MIALRAREALSLASARTCVTYAVTAATPTPKAVGSTVEEVAVGTRRAVDDRGRHGPRRVAIAARDCAVSNPDKLVARLAGDASVTLFDEKLVA